MALERASRYGRFLVDGSPNWVDLYTENAISSKDFYAELFGWRLQKRFSVNPVMSSDQHSEPIEEGQTTLLVLCSGRPSAEIIERDDVFAEMMLPARWYPHVYVVDMATTLRQVEAAGGHVLRAPRQRGCMSTVATILDATGAILCLWQPREQAGNSLTATGGSFTWMELATPDIDATRRFYCAVFEWQATGEPPLVPTAKMQAHNISFTNAMGPVASAVVADTGALATWSPSFAVPNLDDSIDRAVNLGAVAVTAPYDLPVGRQCTVFDPEGAQFSLLGPRQPSRLQRLRKSFDTGF